MRRMIRGPRWLSLGITDSRTLSGEDEYKSAILARKGHNALTFSPSSAQP